MNHPDAPRAAAGDLSSAAWGSKAATLDRLHGTLQNALVKPLVRFSVADWKAERQRILEEISSLLNDRCLVVRSSCSLEDGAGASHAGRFLSLTGVPRSDPLRIADAVDRVIESYGEAGELAANEVLVQGEISDLAAIGVATSVDHSTGAPYFVVNFEDAEPRPESVTAGVRPAKTFVHFRAAAAPPGCERMRRVVALVAELENRSGSTRLDVEFAFDRAETLYLLQVRPLAAGRCRGAIDEFAAAKALAKVRKKVAKLNAPHPYLLGENTVLGLMPDWNPAEIIGVKPRMLALSTYRELVTDSIWAYQRHNYGYRDLRGFPLIRSLMGVPYVDVRLSFNSFLPRTLAEPVAERLVNYYLDRLRAVPSKHDKVEFDIVFSCFYLNLPRRLEALADCGFSSAERQSIAEELHRLTVGVIDPRRGLYLTDLAKIGELERRQELIQACGLPVLDTIYWLVEDCKRYGTLPFAGLARSAFIAVQFLRSMVEIDLLSEEQHASFMSSLKTPAASLRDDLQQLRAGAMPREKFLSRYGHLRPGTYDIMSLRYDEAFDAYFGGQSGHSGSAGAARRAFSLSPRQRRLLERKLAELKLEVDSAALMNFIATAIEGRERAKFAFSRTISDLFVHIERFGERFGFSREELSHLDLQVPLSYYAELDNEDIPDALEASITRNKRAYRVTTSLMLPGVICSPEEVESFYLEQSEPNYISLGQVQGAVVVESELDGRDLTDKIVMIKSADPGYDWLFAKGIGGLITMYGGINSHMAIRAGEQNLPAVIGAGEQLFRLWQTAQRVEIDCRNKLVRILNQRPGTPRAE